MSPFDAANVRAELAEALLGEFAEHLPAIRQITEELFAAPVVVVVESDSEVEQEAYLTFEVVIRDSGIDVLELRREWYRLTASLLSHECQGIRLSVDIQP